MINIYYFGYCASNKQDVFVGKDIPANVLKNISNFLSGRELGDVVNIDDIKDLDRRSKRDFVNVDVSNVGVCQDSNSDIKKCPAFTSYVNQMWSINAPHSIRINSVEELRNSEEVAEKITKSNDGIPILEYKNLNVIFFSSVEDVWIETFPAYFHNNPSLRLIPGSFNIYNWQRPIVPTFEILDFNIEINEGDPLQYIRFRGKDPEERYNLIKMNTVMSDENFDKMDNQLIVKKDFPNKSWKIVTGKLPNLDRIDINSEVFNTNFL